MPINPKFHNVKKKVRTGKTIQDLKITSKSSYPNPLE